MSIESQISELLEDRPDRFEFENTLDSFRKQALFRYETGDSRCKKQIMRAISSNLTLTDKVLRVQAKSPFLGVSENLPCSYLRATSV